MDKWQDACLSASWPNDYIFHFRALVFLDLLDLLDLLDFLDLLDLLDFLAPPRERGGNFGLCAIEEAFAMYLFRTSSTISSCATNDMYGSNNLPILCRRSTDFSK